MDDQPQKPQKPRKPRTPRKKMQDRPLAEQDERAARYAARKDVRRANDLIVKVLDQWSIDQVPDYERFHAAGHAGQFGMTPENTLIGMLTALGLTDEEIEAALESDTSLNYMASQVLLSVHGRIQRMLDWFAANPSGPFARAVAMYARIGAAVRKEFIRQNGYPPEQAPVAGDKITGTESEKAFKPAPIYRPSLFPDESDAPPAQESGDDPKEDH